MTSRREGGQTKGPGKIRTGEAVPLSRIETLTQNSGTDQDYQQVTGTSVDAVGEKRALDTYAAGASDSFKFSLTDLANLLIKGTLPEVNFNQILRQTVSATAQTLAFIYQGSVQFYMDATLINGDYDIIIRETFGMGAEQGDLMLTEGGDTMINEGGS